MKTFKNNQGEEYLFIEVPETLIDDRYFVLWSEKENSFIVEFQCEVGDLHQSLDTESECYAISTTKDITEEIAEKIIDKFEQKIGWRLDGNTSKLNSIVLFQNYKYEKPVPVTFLLETAKESLQSLLDSLKLEGNNYLILKKI